MPNFALGIDRVRVVPVGRLVARCRRNQLAKAQPHHAALVIHLPLDALAADFAARVGAHANLPAGERGGGNLHGAGADRRGRDAPHRSIDRVGRYGSRQRLQGEGTGGRLLDGGNAALVVDAADAAGGAAAGVQPPVELTATVKVHLAANRKAHRAGDDLLGECRQEVDAQHAAGRLLAARVLGLLSAVGGRHLKAVVNRCAGQGGDVLIALKDEAVERFDRLRRPLGGDNFLPHRLLAVDGFGDFYDAVGLELDDAGGVVDAAVADTTRVLEIAVAVIAHGHIRVNLARVRLALLYLAVVVLDEDVVHQFDRARLDAALAQGEVDVAAAVAHRRLPFGGLRLAD